MRARILATAAIAAAVIGAGAAPAHAAVVSTTGAVQIVPAPPSLAKGADQSNTTIAVVNERSLTLTTSLTYTAVDPSGTMTTKTMSGGFCVQSHLVHYDLVGAATAPALTGSATFSMPVLGILGAGTGGNAELAATDASLGVSTTTYAPLAELTRRAETEAILAANRDAVSTSASDPRLLNVTFKGDGFDELRILTGCDPTPVVPEAPMTILLPLGAAAVLGGAAVLRRRRPTHAV